MASDSGQRFIKRNRPPRVHITYQDPYDAEKKVELPFVTGVLADLSGNTPGVEKPDIEQRKFLDIDMDNFDARMGESVKPGISYSVPNKLSEDANEKLSVQLNFRKMDDFSPAAIARQVPAMAKLLEARERLSNLQRFMDGKAQAERELKQLLADADLMRGLKELGASDDAMAEARAKAEAMDKEAE
jgi:type VI secretion system protein ImpB